MIFDMHVHTHESSDCGHIDGADIARYYKNAGYDGIVVTDHFCYPYFEKYADKTWLDLCRRHHLGFEKACEEGKKCGLTVLYGCEIRFKGCSNDFLVYGMKYEFLCENPEILLWDIHTFHEASEKNGFLVYQAHPFRNGMTVQNPGDLFGIEVFNGKPVEDNLSRNAIANIWAERFSLHKIAGSDCHKESEFARAGVNFMCDINNNEQLLEALRSDNYMLLEHTGIQPSSLSVYKC